MLYLSKELGPGPVWRRAGFIVSPEDRVKFRQVEKKEKRIPARENYVQRASGEGVVGHTEREEPHLTSPKSRVSVREWTAAQVKW